MKTKQPTVNQVKKVLFNNKYLKTSYESNKNIGLEEHETFEDFINSIVFERQDIVYISNEYTTNINDPRWSYELCEGLDDEFEKAGIHTEWENAGCVSTWNNN
jgi:hypothetical protein